MSARPTAPADHEGATTGSPAPPVEPGAEDLGALLRAAAARYGTRPAVARRGLLRYERWSYVELLARAETAAAALAARGVGPGDRVLTLAPNSPELVAAYFGVWLAGAILVPLDLRTPPAVIARIAARVAPRLLLYAAAPDPALPDVPTVPLGALWESPSPAPAGRDPGAATRRAAASPAPDAEARAAAPTPEENRRADAAAAAWAGPLPPGVPLAAVAEIVFTSGTTGDPKGVVLTHANVLASVRAGRRLLPLRPGDALLSLLPLSHMLEQTGGLLVPLTRGAQIVYPTSRQPRAILRALRDNGVVALVAVPQALALLRRAIEREVEAAGPALPARLGGGRGGAAAWGAAQRVAPWLPRGARRALFGPVHAALGGRLADVLCGGAYLAPALQAFWERLGVRVVQGYGTTECAPGVTSNTPARRVPGSVGRPLPGVAVRLAPDGEILVRGPNVTPGYWDDPAATAAALADGWYHTGDLGAWDAAGNLYIRGRKRDLIVLADGQNVYPEDVENALRAEPAVRDCLALGTPGPDGAPQVHAVVLPAEGVDAAAVQAAVRRAAAGLAPHQRPTRVTVWPGPDFPRTATLKARRGEVAAALTPPPLSPAGERGGSFLPDTHPPVSEGEEASVSLLPDTPPSTGGGDGGGGLLPLLARLSGRPAATIGPASDLTLDLGLDSLGRIELAALVAEELGVELDDGVVAAVATVGELAALVAAGASATTAPAFPRWSRAAPARLARTALQQALLFPLVDRVCAPLRVEGRGYLRDLRPPLLLIANHTSHLDTPVLQRALPPAWRSRLAVAAAADYWYARRAPGLLATLALGGFPLARQGAVRPSLEYCGELADAGWAVLVFPEGTRSPDGRLQPFKPGIGLLAAELRVPVVPVHLSGVHALLPRGARWPRRGPVTVRFGPALRFAPGTPPAVVTARLAAAVRALGEPSAGC